jgi:predicted HTH domain antitoxin
MTMAQVREELPETIHSVLHCSPSELDKELLLAAAAHWYQQGRISQEWAAEIAGLDRTDFLLALARMGKDSFGVDFNDLDDELRRG